MNDLIIARIQEAGKPNSNGRIYTRECLEAAVEARKLKERTWVTLGMPKNTMIDLEEVAGQAGNWTWDGNMLCAEIALMDTPGGVLAKKLIETSDVDYRFAGFGDVDEHGVVHNYRILSVGVLAKGTGA